MRGQPVAVDLHSDSARPSMKRMRPAATSSLHLRDRGRRGAELGAAVHQRQARGGRREIHRPVERRVATAEDHQRLAAVLGGAAHPVVDLAALERLAARHAEAPRLERADAGGDHDRAGIEHRAGRGDHAEAAAFLRRDLEHFLAEVELRIERLDLLHQAVDQFLRAADRQRRDVVDRLVRIQLGALPARRRQRIEHMGLDAQQAELEHLEQAAGTGADDDDLGTDRPCRGTGGGSGSGTGGGNSIAQGNSSGLRPVKMRGNSTRAQPSPIRAAAP